MHQSKHKNNSARLLLVAREKCFGGLSNAITLRDKNKQLCHILRSTEVTLANLKGVADSTHRTVSGGWCRWPLNTEALEGD